MLTATQFVATIEFGLSTTPLESRETSDRITAVIVQVFGCPPDVAARAASAALLDVKCRGLESIPNDPTLLEIMAGTLMDEATSAAPGWARTVLKRARGLTSPTWINLGAPLQSIAGPAGGATAARVGDAWPASVADSGAPASTEGPLSLPEDGTPRYVIESTVQEETFEQMCLRLKREGAAELAQEDSVDIDAPAAPSAGFGAPLAEPELPPVSLEPPRGPETFGLAPGQDEHHGMDASAAGNAAIDRSILDALERELGGVDVAHDAIDLGTPLEPLDLGDELELELDDATDDDLLGGGPNPSSS
ncbi:MAG: hypothetical protein RLZ94_931 [Actinomycetota bacterium]